MQKEYLSGLRLHHQKPFPMFVISATICGLALYWIYKNAPDSTEQYFYKNYYVFVQAAMLPFYALSTWVLFSSSKLYYAEILVLIVYMIGFMSIIIIPINFLHLFLNNGVISIIEIVVLGFYNVWTYLNFFNDKPGWLVTIKSILNIILGYVLFQIAGNLLMSWVR